MQDYLVQSVESALGQSLKDIEVICVDDGSTDASPELLADLAEKDGRIRLLRQENAGLSAARNAGLGVAQGEYLLFLDADDYLEPKAAEALCACADVERLDQIFFNTSVFFESPEVEAANRNYLDYYEYKHAYPEAMGGRELFTLLVEQGDFKPNVGLQLYRRDFLLEQGLSFYEGILHEDELFTPESLSLASRARVLDRPLHHRRIRGGSIMTSQKSFQNAYSLYVCTRELLAFADERGLVEDRAWYEALLRRASSLCNNAARDLTRLDEEEVKAQMSALDAEDYAHFTLYVYNWYRSKRNSQRSGCKLRRRIKSQQARIEELEGQVEALKASNSWKAGRALTWLPRKIKGLGKGRP